MLRMTASLMLELAFDFLPLLNHIVVVDIVCKDKMYMNKSILFEVEKSEY